MEANRDQTDHFLDEGLNLYDQAGKIAKILMHDSLKNPSLERA